MTGAEIIATCIGVAIIITIGILGWTLTSH
jgi:hypothetical protein